MIHERARLSVLTSLVTNAKGLAFGDLKQLCALTDGNLNRHLRVLEEGKMVEDLMKKHDRNRPQTICKITPSGRTRYIEYLSTLEAGPLEMQGLLKRRRWPAWHCHGPEFLRRSFAVQSRVQYGELHVAIIMDGNGRWATRQALPRVAGHRAGVASVRRVVERAPNLGIRWLTLYAFSSDNWQRPAEEVASIFWLLRAYLWLETERLRENGVRLEVIGRRDRLPKQLMQEIGQSESATVHGQRLHLRIAVDYSSRNAITRAASGIAAAIAPGSPPSADLMELMLAQSLTSDTGEVDLLGPYRW